MGLQVVYRYTCDGKCGRSVDQADSNALPPGWVALNDKIFADKADAQKYITDQMSQ